MQSEEGHIDIAVIGNNIYVRPIGYATQNNSLGLPDFFTAMFKQGCNSVSFDLKDCCGMDSTFLGVIAVAAMSHAHGRDKAVVVLNATVRARHQLCLIGLTPVIALKGEPTEPPCGLTLKNVDLVHLPKTERERIETIKRLHEELIKLNDRNRQEFARFVEMLEAELQQQSPSH